MILADSSVWIDHLRHGSGALGELLEGDELLCHPFVIGELACGNLKKRDVTLQLLQTLPEAPIQVTPSQASRMIDIAQVQGQVHAQSIQKIGELAERNPNETVAIVRQWLQDAPA